jgi:hypothetical protein
LWLSCLSTLACGSDDRRTPPRPEKPSPRDLPAAVRPSMRPMMRRHAERAMTLTRAVALNDNREIALLAAALLEEPKPVAATDAPSDTLNEALPAELFAFDMSLRKELAGLRAAARADDDPAVLRHFSGVVAACRNCHRTFRHPSESATLHAPEVPGP